MSWGEKSERIMDEINATLTAHKITMRDVLGDFMYRHWTADVTHVDEATEDERIAILQFMCDAVTCYVDGTLDY